MFVIVKSRTRTYYGYIIEECQDRFILLMKTSANTFRRSLHIESIKNPEVFGLAFLKDCPKIDYKEHLYHVRKTLSESGIKFPQPIKSNMEHCITQNWLLHLYNKWLSDYHDLQQSDNLSLRDGNSA